MSRAAWILLLGAALSVAHAGMREWTDRAGRKFTADIVACDAWRVTFALPDQTKAVVSAAQLSPADSAFAAKWRAENPAAPLVDPQKLAAWPAAAAAENIEVRALSEDSRTRSFTYEGAHFAMQSDVRLPLGVVRDLNAVFEATRAALMALPLGLHAGGERGKYPVLLFSTAEDYGRAGGGSASGGYFQGNTGRMLILLPNLGIHAAGERRTYDYQKNLFVLKHEVTHQVLRHWGGALPVWFNEGLAEVVAAAPYGAGRYTFSATDTALAAYVQKWRRPGDVKPMIIVPPAQLMQFNDQTWEARVAGQTAYELYNSAALLIHFFLRHDGAGDGSGVAGFLNALHAELHRQRTDLPRGGFIRTFGVPREVQMKAAADFLIRGRSDEKLSADFAAFLKRLGLRYEFDPPLQPGR